VTDAKTDVAGGSLAIIEPADSGAAFPRNPGRLRSPLSPWPYFATLSAFLRRSIASERPASLL
jgi:hypothetical protein